MTNPLKDEPLDDDDLQRLADILMPGLEALSNREPLEGELLRHFKEVAHSTDRFAARYFNDDEAELMRSFAELVASRHPDRFMAKPARVWAGAFKSFVTMCNLADLGPPDHCVKVMRAASVNDEEVQEILHDLHTFLPIPRFEPDDNLAAVMGSLIGHDADAHAKALNALEQQAAKERVSDSLFEFDLRAVPDWIPQERRKLCAEVTVMLDEILGNDLAEGADQILHYYAGAFIQYGSESALANSASDIAAAIAILFVGVLTGVQPDRDRKMIESGDGHLVEIIESATASVRIAAKNDPLPEVMRRELGL